jgi:N-acetylmuramoyl-L-alanine amidase
VRIKAAHDQETITLSLPNYTPHKVFLVPEPDRLVVDVPSVPGRHDIVLPPKYNGKLIKALRFGQFDPNTSRFVFDLAESIKVVSIDDKNGALVVTITSRANSTSDATPEQPATKIAAAAPKKPRKPQKPVIIIDPGHGGVDPGTIGPGEDNEKDIVLEFATMLRDKLLKTGKYDVKLTRDDDTFIMLRERVAIARREHGNLFISLHADSAPEASVSGLSVYTLSEQASDKEAAALATRENKADVLAGMDLSDERQDVADILISLAQRETKNRSAIFADLLVSRLRDKIRMLPNSHRFAGFAVLKAPDIPSVLIETGFLSHSKEEKLLKSKAYRDKVTSGIVSGIDAYFRIENPAVEQ